MNEASESKGKEVAKSETAESEVMTKIGSNEELKTFLHNIYDKMTDGSAAPIYCLSAINHALTSSNIYEMLDEESKELARNIWLRLKAAGLQLRHPPVLFGIEDGEADAAYDW
jgi:uncharacterized protein (DUF608 family)